MIIIILERENEFLIILYFLNETIEMIMFNNLHL